MGLHISAPNSILLCSVRSSKDSQDVCSAELCFERHFSLENSQSVLIINNLLKSCTVKVLLAFHVVILYDALYVQHFYTHSYKKHGWNTIKEKNLYWQQPFIGCTFPIIVNRCRQKF